jgi:hypothetical protein
VISSVWKTSETDTLTFTFPRFLRCISFTIKYLLADAADSKSVEGNFVGVQLPLPAPAQINDKQWFTRLDDWMVLRRSKQQGIFDGGFCQKPCPRLFGCENCRRLI